MSDADMAVDDQQLTADGKIRLDQDPAEYLKRKPKKSILKMKQVGLFDISLSLSPSPCLSFLSFHFLSFTSHFIYYYFSLLYIHSF